jgi:putative nucleotide binding protein
MDNRGRRGQRKETVKEDYAIILDVMDNKSSFKDTTIAQALGYNTYTLFELVPKLGVDLKPGQKVYIGDGKRDEIQYIKRVLYPDKLSGTASSELIYVLMDIIDEKEEVFVNFFNTGGPISLRRHSLEIVPGVGKKHLKTLLDMREDNPFKSFKDIKERCSFLPDPQKAIAERIISEIEGNTDHKFFLRR